MSCGADKKTVDPYHDRSYTQSVARTAQTSKRPPAPVQEMTAPQSPPVRSPARSEETTGTISGEVMLPLLTLVDDRIVAYEMKTEEWERFTAETSTINLDEEQQNKITGCQQMLQDVLIGYNAIHEQLIRESNGHGTDSSIIADFLAVERQDLLFLEGDCRQISTGDQMTGGWIASTKGRMLEERERELAEKMASGEYEQVVELYGRLPLEEDERPSYETSYHYAQALLRSGREDAAAQVLQELLTVLRNENQVEREFKLMQMIADIQFGMENYERAFERYTDIINRYAGLGENIDWARKQQAVISVRNSQSIEVRNFAEIMHGYLTYNPGRDAYRVYLLASRFVEDFPESGVLPAVNHILFESRDRADAWFASKLQEINMLKAEKKYNEALAYIDGLPVLSMPMEKRELLNSLTDELISASFEEEESRRQELEAAMQEIWHKGQEHLRAKEYDQAIEVFTTLLDTAYGDGANDKIIEASQLAAQEDRRKAAELFVQAGGTNDLGKRTDLLLQSRQLLMGILVKYPQSGLVEKAQRNLERIEAEIRAIDPSLLAEPPAESEGNGEMMQAPAPTRVNGIPLGEWQEQVQSGFPQD